MPSMLIAIAGAARAPTRARPRARAPLRSSAARRSRGHWESAPRCATPSRLRTHCPARRAIAHQPCSRSQEARRARRAPSRDTRATRVTARRAARSRTPPPLPTARCDAMIAVARTPIGIGWLFESRCATSQQRPEHRASPRDSCPVRSREPKIEHAPSPQPPRDASEHRRATDQYSERRARIPMRAEMARGQEENRREHAPDRRAPLSRERRVLEWMLGHFASDGASTLCAILPRRSLGFTARWARRGRDRGEVIPRRAHPLRDARQPRGAEQRGNALALGRAQWAKRGARQTARETDRDPSRP